MRKVLFSSWDLDECYDFIVDNFDIDCYGMRRGDCIADKLPMSITIEDEERSDVDVEWVVYEDDGEE